MTVHHVSVLDMTWILKCPELIAPSEGSWGISSGCAIEGKCVQQSYLQLNVHRGWNGQIKASALSAGSLCLPLRGTTMAKSIRRDIALEESNKNRHCCGGTVCSVKFEVC